MPKCSLAFPKVSIMTVSPKTLPNTSLYRVSNLTKSCAKPNAPSFFDIKSACALGLYEWTLLSGKKRTRPTLFRFKNLIAVAAASSSSVTIDCNLAPAATSKAVAYFSSTLPNSAIVPIMPFNVLSSRHCRSVLTPFVYPPNSSLAFCAASCEANCIESFLSLESSLDNLFWWESMVLRTFLCLIFIFSKFFAADLFPTSKSLSWKSASFASVSTDSNHCFDRTICSLALSNWISICSFSPSSRCLCISSSPASFRKFSNSSLCIETASELFAAAPSNSLNLVTFAETWFSSFLSFLVPLSKSCVKTLKSLDDSLQSSFKTLRPLSSNSNSSRALSEFLSASAWATLVLSSSSCNSLALFPPDTAMLFSTSSNCLCFSLISLLLFSCSFTSLINSFPYFSTTSLRDSISASKSKTARNLSSSSFSFISSIIFSNFSASSFSLSNWFSVRFASLARSFRRAKSDSTELRALRVLLSRLSYAVIPATSSILCRLSIPDIKEVWITSPCWIMLYPVA